ncbi:DUF4286 family protein [Undibacterium amnicola]|uniref:DUF4286 family protein n=1 Tax=Undibacterium amnicola TaxID=1834038 RepID=A0ABR6XT36_9BURK|nr:DUF4286 family protein [Undibacterium amnicola]MBC3832607.1 DUF4286 family protein [Undibacterium amnicola]
MVFYEVSVTIRADLAETFMAYMRKKHIPEIYATQCFQQIHFDHATENTYRTCYQAASQEDYNRYIEQYAHQMRADFMQHFPDGCEVSRKVWMGIQTWGN